MSNISILFMTLLIKNFTKQKLNPKYLNKVAEKTLENVKFKKPVEISLVITGEKRIRTLNKKYRGIDNATDVLSFGNSATNKTTRSKIAKFVNPPDNVLHLGEIFICHSQAVKQAKQKKHSIKRELAILLIHGILHLLGYEHRGDYRESEMKIIEEKVLRKL